ncbi:MAG: hypothetical protein ACUVTE_04215 [Candidatus Bathycorpusculaceae bacterium]
MEKRKVTKNFVRMFLIIVLAANVVLTIINLYLAVQFNQTLTNLKLQGYIPDSTFTLTVNADDVDLGKPVAYYFGEAGVLKQTIHFGTLYASGYVIMPHYGVVTIKLKSFNVTESKYLSHERLNETEISYADEEKNYVYVLAPGFNQINAQIQLKAKVPLNPENLPSENESFQFSLGLLFLEAEAFDFENKTKIVSEFSSEIFITIEAPKF